MSDKREACPICDVFHDSNVRCGLDAVDDHSFCVVHPDTPPKMVQGVEGDDIGYECPDCEVQLCKVHPNVEMLAIPNREGTAILKHVCPCCAHIDALKETQDD